MTEHVRFSVVVLAFLASVSGVRGQEGDALPSHDVIMRAMVTELERSMSDLVMEDLERPYFIQYSVDDSVGYMLTAEYGALTRSDRMRRREFRSQVRVGSLELDNTHFAGGGGGVFLRGGVQWRWPGDPAH